MSTTLNVGRRLPAYCTSIGHVMLAHLPQGELDEYLARVRFHPYTEHTPNSKEALLALLQAVRESGFAFASQLMEPRLCTLAVPVRDAGGHYVAGINVILQGRLLGARRDGRAIFPAAARRGDGAGLAAAALTRARRARPQLQRSRRGRRRPALVSGKPRYAMIPTTMPRRRSRGVASAVQGVPTLHEALE